MKRFTFILLLVFVSSLAFPLREVNSEVVAQSGYLYGGIISSPGKVLKIDLATFTAIDTLTISVNQPAHALLLIGDSLFVGTLGIPATILQIRLSDFSEVNKVTLPNGFNNVIKLEFDGTYLYACLSTGQVAKFTVPSLSMVDMLTTYNNGRAEGAQYYNGFLYVTSVGSPLDSPAYLEKFDATTLSFVDRIQLSFKRAAFGLLVGNLYYIASNGVEGSTGSTAGVMEVNLDEFREVRVKAFDTGDSKGAADKPVKYGEYLFLNGDTEPLGRVYRVRISDFSWSYINVTGPRLGIPTILGNYGYFPSVNQLAQPPGPSQIFKVNLDTFSQEDVLTFQGEPGIPQIVIQSTQVEDSIAITGVVADIDTAAPISGATVTVNGYSMTTNSTGGYAITGLPTGSYTVSVSALGYEAKSTALNAPSQGSYRVDFQIKKAQEVNEAIIITIAFVSVVLIIIWFLRSRKKPARFS